MANISLKSVDKSYDGKTFVIKNFNLEVEDKEFIVLAGPFKCGKSTILKMIAGTTDIKVGEIFIGDKCVNKIPAKNRNVALVSKNNVLYPNKSVRKNMIHFLKYKKISKSEITKKIEEIAEILNIKEFLDIKSNDLSNEISLRVFLAIAMLKGPDIFLLDDVLFNLENKLKIKMRIEILKLYNLLKKTFIYATSDQMQAMAMGFRVVVMENGSIKQIDFPERLYNKPNSLFVANFIGFLEMNFFDAVLLKREGEFFIKTEEIIFPVPISKVILDSLDLYVDKKIIIGIWPEDIHTEEIFLKFYKNSILKAKVFFVEFRGHEKIIYLDFKGKYLVLRASSISNFKKGEKIKFVFDFAKIYMFDKKTKKSICG